MGIISHSRLAEIVDTVDVIIIGAGIAGVLAAQHMAQRAKVLVISGGEGMDETDKAFALTKTYDFGHYANDYWAAHWVRAFGGTARRWRGWCRTLDALDFESLPIRPSAWPFGKATLDPYYVAAAQPLKVDMGLADQNTDLSPTLLQRPYAAREPLDHRGLRDIVRARDNLFVINDINLSRLSANAERSRITQLTFMSYRQQAETVDVSAKRVMLCCGGLGNAQLLLQPSDSGPPVGDESGLVGKYLMEHPHYNAAGEALLSQDFANRLSVTDGVSALCLPDAIRREKNRMAVALEPMVRVAKTTTPPNAPFPVRVPLNIRAEMRPQPQNAARLVGSRNAAGLYELETRCLVDAADFHAVMDTAHEIGVELARRGLGTLRLDSEKLTRQLNGGGHTMGTTRMGISRQDSVCDGAGRVHGYANLYVGGSSLFPTGGAANPTLTIAALALRTADLMMEHPL